MDAISALLNLGQIASKIDNQMKEGERRSMIKNSRVEWKDNDVSSADNSMDSSSEALDDRGFPMASDSKKAKNTTATISEPITQVCLSNLSTHTIVSLFRSLPTPQKTQLSVLFRCYIKNNNTNNSKTSLLKMKGFL